MAARDRLAAIRAQQGVNPYRSDASTPSTRQTRNPYDQRDNGYSAQNNNYELSQVGNRTNYSQTPEDDNTTFINEIASLHDEIASYNKSVDEIGRLHAQLLSSVEPGDSRGNQRLEDLIQDTRSRSDVLRRRIQSLQRQPMDQRTAALRKPQLDLVRSQFMDAIQRYQRTEKEYSDKYKDRMARQFKIVNPNATDDEVRQVVNNDQGGQIFTQAMMGNRYQEAQGAYREVQQRHEEVRRIERTIAELAQLFNDVSLLVEEQNNVIDNIESTTGVVEKDTEAGLGYTDKAVVSARAARRKRWICFFITLVVLAIIGIVVGIEVSQHINNNKN